MNVDPPIDPPATIRTGAARLAVASAFAVILLLASLHLLSPEFDPSFRVVSEYANGHFGWVLSLMFACWAVSSWGLALALWPQLHGISGKIAVGFLIAAGIGEAMAAFCDINHPLHNLAGAIGVLSLPIAAVRISVRLSHVPAWAGSRRVLLIAAHLTWIALALMAAALIALVTRHRITPPGIQVIGWANRLVVVVYCAWVIAAACQMLRTHGRSRPPTQDP